MKNKKDNYNIRVFVATILSAILMLLWMRYYGKKTLPQAVENINKEIKQEQNIQNKETEKQNVEIKKEENNLSLFGMNQELEINTEKLKGSINLRGLVFDNLILEKYNKNIGSTEKVRLLSPQNTNNSYFVKFGWKSHDKTIDLPNQNTLWQSDSKVLTTNNPVILYHKNNDGILFQLILLIDHNYMFTFKQSIINNSNKTINIKVFNEISKKFIPNSSDTVAGVHEGFIGSFDNKTEEIKYKKLTKKNFSFDDNFRWAGFTDKYWLVSMAIDKDKVNLFDVNTSYLDNSYIINFEGENITINPNQKDELNNLLFTGPKILSLLDQYSFQYDLPLFDRSVDFGWFYFLTKPIYIILKTFYSFFGNFGIAILFLTFVVKFIMYPFTKRSYVSMARMKELQPKIQALKTRYSDDKMKINKETIELYKKENVSPLSGCLPMLIQIPVFFSLYKVLAISIDMRQAPFFGYIKNLAEKDPTTIWNLFGLLPYKVSFLQIGLLPCLMALTMWVQQKMTSMGNASPETQTATKLMPVIFLFLFAGMPTGLLIYWTFSNIITIGQQYYVEKKFSKIKK